MDFKTFKKSGHWPTLLGAFLYFDISFMIWVIIGSLGIFIAKDFNLDATEKGFLVAVPLLGGALLRLPMGILADRIGSKKTALLGLSLTIVPLLLGWFAAQTLPQMIMIGLFLGIAGSSFAVALPMASRWYPPEQQGLAMGIAGAGNSGTVIAAFFGPRLAEVFGWHAVFGLALIPLALVTLYFALFTKDSPNQPAPVGWSSYLALCKEPDALLFCLFYMITFGGFVGFASFLPIFFHDQYSVAKVMAGNITALCVFGGSFSRPIGGYIADRIGGVRALSSLYAGVALLLVLGSLLLPLPAMVFLLFSIMMCLGMGNGAVFQLVPQRFKRQIGTISGLVGCAGGLGGFCLPLALGTLKDRTGTYGAGFFLFAIICAVTLVILRTVQSNWRKEWQTIEARI